MASSSEDVSRLHGAGFVGIALTFIGALPRISLPLPMAVIAVRRVPPRPLLLSFDAPRLTLGGREKALHLLNEPLHRVEQI